MEVRLAPLGPTGLEILVLGEERRGSVLSETQKNSEKQRLSPDHFELIILDQHAKGRVTIWWAWGAPVN